MFFKNFKYLIAYILFLTGTVISGNALSDEKPEPEAPMIGSEMEAHMSWTGVMDAMREGHKYKLGGLDDILFKAGSNSMLTRAAWVEGLGMGQKTATVFPNNQNLQPPKPNINSVFSLFETDSGTLRACINGSLVTKWKTVGDSILGSKLLARPDSKTLTIIGAGAVAKSLIPAYKEVFPKLKQVFIWNRNYDKAALLAAQTTSPELPVHAFANKKFVIGEADIIASATMAVEPVIPGEWVKPGTHVDLIGAYRPDMREADDDLMKKARVFVDFRNTTVNAIGELMIPIQNGVITETDVIGDFYDLLNNKPGRRSREEITVFKNGGGAHLDVMTGAYVWKIYNEARYAISGCSTQR